MASLQLVDYQHDWPAQFEALAAQLREVLAVPGRSAFRLEHIGSTAVPGLCAKPVLDLLLGVATLAEAEAAVPALAAAGFLYRPEHETQIPERRYFVRPADALPRVHLHAVVQGGVLWMQHLRFRDRLRQDEALRQAYASLKQGLALRHAEDKVAYTLAKAPFIRQVLDSKVA